MHDRACTRGVGGALGLRAGVSSLFLSCRLWDLTQVALLHSQCLCLLSTLLSYWLSLIFKDLLGFNVYKRFA